MFSGATISSSNIDNRPIPDLVNELAVNEPIAPAPIILILLPLRLNN